ncbi:MAG: antitoxin (DNA-binding transcriptional repressor) of toxin-antitoxin stability system [Akkermansiaceae bacterium]|jgi:antitoxin (DNA-binding transcriptional repressor) of toxin-antitoxin stability system
MSVKQIPVSQFKAHCSEELREIEENDITIEITRHGKVIAIAKAPEPPAEPGSLLGAGIGTAKLGPRYDPHEPAFDYEDWAMNQEDSKKDH